MLKSLRLSAMLLTLGVGSLFAVNPPSPGEWKITGEYVFLKPSVDDTFFVIQNDVFTTVPRGKTLNNDPDFESGFRVGAQYGLCESGRTFAFDYLRLHSEQNRTVSGGFLWATVGRPDTISQNFESFNGSARSKLNTLYERADACIIQPAGCLCDVETYFSLGLEYAFVRFQENYDYFNSGNASRANVFQKSRTWGIGPQFGFGLDYALCGFEHILPGCGNWYLNLKTSASILAAESGLNETNTLDGANQLSTLEQSTWRLIPVLHARLGFTYADCTCWGDYELSAGYEFSSYSRAVARSQFPDDTADALRYTSYYNFDVQGLYISAAFSF